MSRFIPNLIEPYVVFCRSAAYSFSHNMESVGWISSWRGTVIDPYSTFMEIFGFYLLVFIPIFLLVVLASFTLNRILGIAVTIVWLIPGLLSVFQVPLFSVNAPDTFYVSDGMMYVGETKSTLFNVLLTFLVGWSTITLFVHFAKLKKGFKELYDHVWYVVGLTAVVFFVTDSNTAFYKSALDESERNIRENISLTLNHLNFAHSECLTQSDELIKVGVSKEFCEWIPEVKYDYFWMSESASFTRDTRSKDDIRALIPPFQLTSISKFNQYICTSTEKASKCNPLSFNFGRFDEAFDYPDSRYALAVVPLNKSLAAFWKQSSNNSGKLETAKRNPNIKWLFYMILGFVAGGKVANSSRSLAGEPKPVFRRWFRSMGSLMAKSFSSLLAIFTWMFKLATYAIRFVNKFLFKKWL